MKKQAKQSPTDIVNALAQAHADHISTLTGAYARAHVVGEIVYLSFMDGTDGDHTCMRFVEFNQFMVLFARVMTMARDARHNSEVSEAYCRGSNGE